MPTPSPERVRAVLDDLFALDPALREHGADLEDAVRTLLASKPNANIDNTFAASLRRRLMQKATEPAPLTFMQKFSLKLLVPTAAIAAVAVIAAVVVTQPGLMKKTGSSAQPTGTDHPIALASGVTITKTDAHGFGDLTGTTGATEGKSGAMNTGMGGGAPSMVSAPVPAMAPMADGATPEQEADMAKRVAVGSVGSSGGVMVPADYSYDRYRYTYDGTLPDLQSSVDVYRRVKHPLTGLGGSLGSASLGFMDLSKFGGTDVQQFTLTQSGPYGYQIYVDLNEGSVNINQDWTSWPQAIAQPCIPGGPCGGQLAASDIPDDATITGISDAFLSDKGISKDGYGAPLVDRRWSIVQPYMKGTDQVTSDMKIRWAPQTVNVVYPIQINGMTAYDSSGFPYGLSVSVDVKEKKVSSVWNLTALQYESSSYDAITDSKTILDYASRGDLYAQPFGQDPNEHIVDEKLGDPTLVLMQSWHQTADNVGEEILVPALRFSVTKTADGGDYRDAVMVPLVKELMQPQVMMYMKGGAAGSGVAVPMNTGTVATPPPATAPMPIVAPKE